MSKLIAKPFMRSKQLNRLGRLRLSIIVVLLMQSSVPAYADLQQEMDSMFGTMTNFNAPTAHLGQRRGGDYRRQSG